ncbi:MAG: RDD family protein [Halanaeroarchaeum sp.]
MMTDPTATDTAARIGDTDVVGARALAQIVDALVTIVLFASLAGGLVLLLAGPAAIRGAPLLAVLMVGSPAMVLAGAVASLYPVVLEWRWDGQTVGKRVAGIRVVARDGGPIGPGSALSRNVFAAVDAAFFYLVGLAAMATSPDRQRVGDRVAGTVVVRSR